MGSQHSTFRDQATGDVFRIRFDWVPWWRASFRGQPAHFRMVVEERPECEFRVDLAAHLHPGEVICVREGDEPRTLERAKAIAMLWLRGFGEYRRTGVFSNDGGRINVMER